MLHYSYSSLQSFKTCPRKYAYRYKEKATHLDTTIEAFTGKLVHQVFEELYTFVQKGKVPEKSDLLSRYSELWDKSWNDNIRIIKKGYEPEHYREMGRRCVDDYYEKYKPFDQNIIGIERIMHIPINDTHRMKCIIDRIDKRDDGVYEIHDYKTSQYLPADEDVSKDTQLPLYEIALKKLFSNIKDVELVWHYVALNEEVRTKKTEDELNQVWQGVLDDIDMVESATEFPTKSSNLCKWCEYQHICPETRHAHQLSTLTPEQVSVDDGQGLAEKYIHYAGLKKEADDELGKLRKQIIKYCRDNDMHMLSGYEKEINVKMQKTFHLPKKDESGYYEVLNLMKNSEVWNDYVNLDIRKVAKSKTLPEELRNKLNALGKEKEDVRISVRMKKEED